jgi:hypothetical protein
MAEDLKLNPPELLPPVGCPLLIQVEEARTVRASRTSHIADKNRQMEYLLSDGSRITGRFWWTYP